MLPVAKNRLFVNLVIYICLIKTNGSCPLLISPVFGEGYIQCLINQVTWQFF
jgi:hypothetical protein